MKKILLVLVVVLLSISFTSCERDDGFEYINEIGTFLTINDDTRTFEDTNPSLRVLKGITHNVEWQYFSGDMKTIYLRVYDDVGDFLPGFGGYNYNYGEGSDEYLLLKIQINADFNTGIYKTFDFENERDGNNLPDESVNIEILYTEWFSTIEGYNVSIEESNTTYIITFNNLKFRNDFSTGHAIISGRIEVDK